MSIADFKTEFSALLKRYAAATASSDESSGGSSHNYQDILDAVQDTLRSVLDVKLKYLEEASMRTPGNNEIVLSTPSAPDVLRMDCNQIVIFEALKSLAEMFKMYDDGSLKLPNACGSRTQLVEDKPVDVLDNDSENNNSKDAKNANLSTTTAQKEHGNSHPNTSTLSHIVDEALQNVRKVSSSLQRMADILSPQSRASEPAVRRLSAMLNPESAREPAALNQSFANIRGTMKQRARKVTARRSAAAESVATTPTTSRPTTTTISHIPHLQKSKRVASGAAAASASKLGRHSVSMSSFPVIAAEIKAKSPGKLAKNPKYAHVQSTIPKAISIKNGSKSKASIAAKKAS